MTVNYVNIGRDKESLNIVVINLLDRFNRVQEIFQCYPNFKHSPNNSSYQCKCRKSEF